MSSKQQAVEKRKKILIHFKTTINKSPVNRVSGEEGRRVKRVTGSCVVFVGYSSPAGGFFDVFGHGELIAVS